MEKGDLKDYLLAVEKGCIKKDPELTQKLADSPSVLLFSNFPGVENVCKFLDKASVDKLPEQKKKKRKK